jgi:hypothetical protein
METELEMVLRHVRQGEAHIVGQIKIVDRLLLAGCPTVDAYDLLDHFENTLRLHNDHLGRLLRKTN